MRRGARPALLSRRRKQTARITERERERERGREREKEREITAVFRALGIEKKKGWCETHSMTKTPPHRRGITFEVGAALEARDSLKNWYAASIEKIDYEDEKVLIHYRQWSHRYDEWFDWSSPYLRPVERIQLRRQGLQEHNMAPVTACSRKGFQINQKVLASWSDCRYYPAKILSRDKDDSYTVKFFDGVIKTVKGLKIKPFRKENTSNKPGQPSRKSRTSGKNGKTKENGRNQQDGESESEEEDSKGTEKCAKLQDNPPVKSEPVEMPNGHQAHKEEPSGEDLKAGTQENGGGEAMEMDREGDEEKVGETLQNGAHESCGEGQEKDEKDKEDSLGQNRKTRGKVAEVFSTSDVVSVRPHRSLGTVSPFLEREETRDPQSRLAEEVL